ncbi:methylated-DNA--[protein]-cysteine S-methyltransferase [Castellaniella caeni]
MPYHALIASPLGDILLQADAVSLTGLYFTDQRDCPRVAGLAAVDHVIRQPSAGSLDGHATRTFKVVPVTEAATGELFPPVGSATGTQAGVGANPGADVDTGAGTHASAGTGTDANASAVTPGSVRLLQADTPPAVQALFEQTRRELDEYWQGRRQHFDVVLSPSGTAFQKQVWQALLRVPCGATLSYGELAQAAGLGAGHGRAVGAAVGSNPISIIIPCHRILARNGTLNGYGGGLNRKIRLLQIEGFRVQA